jgi:hypothetical protein
VAESCRLPSVCLEPFTPSSGLCNENAPRWDAQQASLGGALATVSLATDGTKIMTGPKDDHERTMAFAEIAFGQIKAQRQPASPRHFEIWYNYATGYNPSLNQLINEMLARDGALIESNIDQIYETYISPTRFTDRIDHVGARVKGEIEQAMAMIGAAAGSASHYTENLANASEMLGSTADRTAISGSAAAW